MAESVVSFAVEHIGNMIVDESNTLLCDVGSEAGAVCSDLEKIEELLAEAQQKKELANSEQVHSWLAQLRRIAYDAEDVVDIYFSETESGVSIISSLSLGFANISRAHQASKKLRMLRKQMQTVKARLDQCTEGSTRSREGRLIAHRSQSSKGHRQAYDDFVVGIQNDVEKLVQMLLIGRENYHEHQDLPSHYVDVLTIVGMGGSGKTTLARNIFNHQIVQKHFKCLAWVTPMKEWDISKVVYEILRQIDSNKQPIEGQYHDQPHQVLKARLKHLIRTKTCLLVLDDVWDWEFLQEIILTLFLCDNEDGEVSSSTCATKIVITSRQRPQPSITRLKWFFHDTHLLSEEDSWYLFNKVSKSDEGKELAKEYRSLAMEMLRKCEGLPLAIVALGRLLKRKDTIQEWERVFSQLVSKDGPYLYGPVNDILALSYDDLRYYLQPCFLYFGLFQDDSTITVGKLMRMWIAEGFVQRQCRSGETWEDAARRLLQKLIDNTLVQVVKRTYGGKAKTLRIHDIMRDLCIMKAQDLDFLTVCSSESDHLSQKNSRRTAINLSKWSILPLENSHLRTLLLYGPGVDKHASNRNQQANLDIALVCEKFKLLRVLDIKGIRTSDGTMPKEVGNLIHLRYLRVRSTNIHELPKSIAKLRKLLVLDYWNVSVDNYEIRLPNVLWKLRSLRHLFLPYEMNNAKENFKLHTIKGLRTLWGVRGGNWMLREMGRLSSTLQKLSIQGISTAEQIESVLDSPVIKTYDHLYSLALDWYGFPLELDGLQAMCWKHNLHKLRLMGRAQEGLNPLKFPNNLGKLELYFTQLKQPESVAALGKLQSLKYLRLAKDSYMESEWIVSDKEAFPKLEELKLSNLQKLEKWEMVEGAMPCLKKLSIVSCTSLICLAKGLKSITTLEKLKIERMPTNFISRLQKVKDWNANKSIGGEDLYIIENIRSIVIRDSCSPVLFSNPNPQNRLT